MQAGVGRPAADCGGSRSGAPAPGVSGLCELALRLATGNRPHAPAGLHNGIDLPAPAGAMVHAAAAGRIVAIRRQGLGGVAVRVEHADGLQTYYGHLGTLVPAVAEGRRALAAGEPIGRVARTGVTYGTHLFFAVFAAGQAVDPQDYLKLAACAAK